MRILGVDPGLAALGYGCVDCTDGRFTYLAAGDVRTRAAQPLGERLNILHSALVELILTHQPTRLAFERQIYCQNIQTALTLGHVAGIVELAAAQHGLAVWSATPRELKSALAGQGRASKEQVARAVQRLLNLDDDQLSDHATDALGAAIACGNRAGLDRRIARAGATTRRRQRK